MFTDDGKKRPCCLMLRELSESLGSLKDPQAMQETMEVLSQHCVLMKLFGRSKVKWDLAKSDCFLAISPDDAQTVVDELGKTRALNDGLEHFDAMLSFINGILANNALVKQIQDKNPAFLVALREGEKAFAKGRVPETSLLKKENNMGNELSAADRLLAHPALKDKTQYDGISDPKANPYSKENPEAAQNQEQLQHQLKPKPQQQLTNAAKLTPVLKPK